MQNHSTRFIMLFIFFVSTNCCFAVDSIFAIAAHIHMDGYFSDWESIEPVYSDQTGEQSFGRVDFGKIRIANDDQYLYLNIEVGIEISMLVLNEIALHIDTDNDPGTGNPFRDIGVEIEWHFGSRIGAGYIQDGIYTIDHTDLKLVTVPTMTSTRFEIAIIRDAVSGSWADSVRIVFTDGTNRDAAPDDGSMLYPFDDSQTQGIPVKSLKRESTDHLRVLSYNVLNDSPWRQDRNSSFQRILTSIAPDIIGFQEIYSHSAAQAQAYVDSLFQGQWFSAKVDPDVIVVSRYPIIGEYSILGNGAFVIDLRPRFDSELLLINAHPPCCTDNAGRQRENDAIMAFIRDNRDQNRDFELKPNTPIMIIGDMNLVGYAIQLHTLLNGFIVNGAEFGSSFAPDWDGSSLTSLLPRHTDSGMYYTWFSDYESVCPGILDYMIYSDSVIEPGNSFVLYTPGMSADSLAKHGLEADDAEIASDHLPVVGDFMMPNFVGISDETTSMMAMSFQLEHNYPNPFNASTLIRFHLSTEDRIKLSVYDIQGREIGVIAQGHYQAGSHVLNFNAYELPSGLYFYSLETSEGSRIRKMCILK